MYTCMYMNTCIYTYVNRFKDMLKSASVRIDDEDAYIDVFRCIRMYLHIHIYLYIHLYAPMYVCIYIYLYIYINIYWYLYIGISIHI